MQFTLPLSLKQISEVAFSSQLSGILIHRLDYILHHPQLGIREREGRLKGMHVNSLYWRENVQLGFGSQNCKHIVGISYQTPE